MIEAKDLSVGYLINLNDAYLLKGNQIYEDLSVVTVTSAHIEMCKYFNDDFNIFYKPIPITEEWLLKFGFDRMEKFPLKYVNKIKDDSLTDFEPVIVVGDMWLKNLKYVHQLQNLYFALTQTELEIK